MAAIQGSLIIVKYDPSGTPTAFALQRGATLNMPTSMIDVSTKSSANWSEVIPGFRQWSVDIEALYDPSDTTYDQLWGAYNGQSVLEVEFQDGTNAYTGNTYISDLSIDGPHSAEGTYTATLNGTSTLTKGTPA